MFEILILLFLIRLLWFCFKHANLGGQPTEWKVPYMRRSTPYAARLGRKQVKTDYSGDDWGW